MAGRRVFRYRYEYAGAYVHILRELWTEGCSDFKGRFFQMGDCRLSLRPQVPIKVICAGQSTTGMLFTATYADYNFCLGRGANTPTAMAPTVARMQVVFFQNGWDLEYRRPAVLDRPVGINPTR